tara:strand:- start:4225 stop:4698 length:474 start_codon:yes stop_codon:yes gene_type:complete
MSPLLEKWKDYFQKPDRITRRVFVAAKGCCAIEVENLIASTYDIQRLGIDFVQDPRSASLMIVSGWIDDSFADEIIENYAYLEQDKKVVAVGICSVAANIFYTEKKIRLADLVPVASYIPGCPPRPEAMIQAILNLDVPAKKTKKMTYLSEVMKSNG